MYMVRPDDDKSPRIRVVRIGVSNLWVSIQVLSFINQITMLKLLYLYKAPLFLNQESQHNISSFIRFVFKKVCL